MMFVGAIPKECVEQSLRIVDLAAEREVFVCCSGSLRIEQAICKQHPSVAVHSNDVSLFTTVIASLVVGRPRRFLFKGEFQFLEDALVGGEPVDRAAALAVALRMTHFRPNSAIDRAHIDHYRANGKRYIEKAREHLVEHIQPLKLADFYCGDFREHARNAIARGALVVAWPPTYARGYEKLFQLIDANTEWDPPTYPAWDPKVHMAPWLDELDRAGARYLVCHDHPVGDREPAGIFQSAMVGMTSQPRGVYLYCSVARTSSVRRKMPTDEVRRYEPVEPELLGPDAEVKVLRCSPGLMHYIRTKHVTRVPPSPGEGAEHWLVLVDGKLAGGFTYGRAASAVGFGRGKVDPLRAINIFADFAVTGAGRLPKLILMLAAGREQVRGWDLRRIHHTRDVLATVLSKHPVSMVHRGAMRLHSRKPWTHSRDLQQLNYTAAVRSESNGELYRRWWRTYCAPTLAREVAQP